MSHNLLSTLAVLPFAEMKKAFFSGKWIFFLRPHRAPSIRWRGEEKKVFHVIELQLAS
jgi:hypothetical protein